MIHECLRFEQPQIVRMHIAGRHQAMIFGLVPERHFVRLRQFVYPPEADVMARAFIFRTRITQANDQAYHIDFPQIKRPAITGKGMAGFI
jgi:hypothetical protein